MATAMYDHGREEFGNGNIDWVNDDIRVILIDTANYTVNFATDQDRADISDTAELDSAALASKTNTDGVLDAADTVFASLTLAEDVDALVIYKHTGVQADDTLIAYIDNAPELPVTTNGSDLTITWDSGANKIFKL